MEIQSRPPLAFLLEAEEPPAAKNLACGIESLARDVTAALVFTNTHDSSSKLNAQVSSKTLVSFLPEELESLQVNPHNYRTRILHPLYQIALRVSMDSRTLFIHHERCTSSCQLHHQQSHIVQQVARSLAPAPTCPRREKTSTCRLQRGSSHKQSLLQLVLETRT